MSLVISSLFFDKLVYNPGEVVTLTVDYTSTDSSPADIASTVTVTAVDASSTAVPVTGTLTVAAAGQAQAVTVGASDDRIPPGTWVLVSNAVSGTGPFTGIAVLTSTA
jgi:hypothetical protein